MNYNNIVVIANNKLTYGNNNKECSISFSKDILNDGKILSEQKFILKYLKFLKSNNISTFLWTKNILVIYDNMISRNDIKVIMNAFSNMGYHNIKIVSDISLLNGNKKDMFYFKDMDKLFYIDDYNQKHVLKLDKNVSEEEIYYLISRRNKNRCLIIVGSEIESNINIIEDYYIYDSTFNFFKNLHLKKV